MIMDKMNIKIVYFHFSFCQREGDEQRTYLALPPIIAPYKCSVLPLSKNEKFDPIIEKISKELTDNDIAHKVYSTFRLWNITFQIFQSDLYEITIYTCTKNYQLISL